MSEQEKTMAAEEKLTMTYVLEQLEALRQDAAYIRQTITELGKMSDGETSDTPGAPANVLGQAKAQALADVVRCRETTNQQFLKLYEKMYDDLKPKVPTLKESALEFIEQAIRNTSMETLAEEQYDALAGLLDTVRHIDN